MNPELTVALAVQRSRELAAEARAHRAAASQVPRPRSVRILAPGYRINWSRVSLALTDGDRPRTSWAIVISGTRTH
jgi:hypothetical protein